MRLYFVTTSWHETGRGSIDEAEALKFVKGFNLVVRDFDLSSFNNAITSRKDELDEAVRNTDTQFVLAVGHTGTQEIHADVHRAIEKVQENLNDVDPHMVSFESYSQSRVYESAMGLTAHSDISLEIKLLHFGRIAEPYPAFYGQVVLSDVAAWKKYGDSLFDYNLRRIIPGSEVNGGSERRSTTNRNTSGTSTTGLPFCASRSKRSALAAIAPTAAIFTARVSRSSMALRPSGRFGTLRTPLSVRQHECPRPRFI